MVGLIRDGLPAGETVGVALSGGGDSTALLHLCLAAGLKVEAVTVDHALRPESAAEAAAVGAGCRTLGVPHEVLLWEHGPIRGNLMDQARRARMGLVADWARARGIGVVALGHTRDDQAETVLMGLSRGAGIDGLSGMRRAWDQGGIRFRRPLLAAGREELRDWLRQRRIGWIDDPTNDNARFTRVRARKALAALAPLGITGARLAEVAGHLAQVQEALRAQVAAAGARVVRQAAGALQVLPGIHEEPAEVRRQLVAQALRWLTGADYAPRAGELERLIAAMVEPRQATLAGCRFKDTWLMREPRAVGGPVPVGQVWDGRWRVTGPAGEVRALGAAGLRQVPDWRATGLPREVLLVTPAIWRGAVLVSAPLAGLSGGGQAELVRPFHLFGRTD
ncbi:tRNA lysidine(34) synthetase TilS [Rhodobacter sp. M37P]|uniref:tRNA(Ile)-lysidine synthase n=1 Tax=Rhodobacter calidifons TaxID=2715277 RepID=A0ABX0G4V6_9RHOB|nr:tRNA lysidine(34) synthetase TilS [Rhodobacter calidifons]